MESSKKARRGRPSKLDKIPKVGKGEGNLDTFIKQMQKNKSDSDESDSEAEGIMDDGYVREETSRITTILTGIFDEMKDLKNEMKKITSENRELRKLVAAWENQWRDEKRDIHLKLEELENKIKQLDIDTRKISDQRNVKIQDLEMIENKIELRVKEKIDKTKEVEMQKIKTLVENQERMERKNNIVITDRKSVV